MKFSRQEYRSGLPFPLPGDLPDPGIESVSPALAGRFFFLKQKKKLYLFYFWLGCAFLAAQAFL